MASTYSSTLNLELQATGENSGTWGTIVNNNLQKLESATKGYVSVAIASTSDSLSATFSIGDETAFGEAFQNLISFSTGEPDFFVWNETDDSQTVTWKDVEPGSSD